MRMALEGMGIVAPFGNGIKALKQAAFLKISNESNTSSTPATDTEPLKKHVPVRSLRRVDHFTRMTLLAAYEAVNDAGLSPADMKDAGIVLATGYGPARLTFDFLDSIIDYGPNMASPLAFSHSVHNIPAATVALSMHINGPCFTVSQFETSVAAAFLTARTWLAEERVERVLVGAVDEYTELLQENSTRMALELSSETSGGRRNHPPGEGAVFFCLHADASRARHGFIDQVKVSRVQPDRAQTTPVFFSGAAGPRHRAALTTTSLHDFSNVYGNIPTAMAFDIALATCVLQGVLSPRIITPNTICCLSRDRFGTVGKLIVTPQEI